MIISYFGIFCLVFVIFALSEVVVTVLNVNPFIF